MAALRLDRTGLARAAEVDRKTVDNFLDRGMKPRTSKRGGYESALGWTYGSLAVVARGGEPELIPTITAELPPQLDDGSSTGAERAAAYVSRRKSDVDLSDMPTEQLLAEANRLLAEVARRAGGENADARR